MPNPAINVTTTTEVGYCPFCGRTRNLRREERHLGGLVRTTIVCESCHRTLSSNIGPPAPRAEPERESEPELEPETKPEPVKAKAKAAAKKPAATKKKTTATTRKAPAKKK